MMRSREAKHKLLHDQPGPRSNWYRLLLGICQNQGSININSSLRVAVMLVSRICTYGVLVIPRVTLHFEKLLVSVTTVLNSTITGLNLARSIDTDPRVSLLLFCWRVVQVICQFWPGEILRRKSSRSIERAGWQAKRNYLLHHHHLRHHHRHHHLALQP